MASEGLNKPMADHGSSSLQLTEEQKQRIQRNKEKAKSLRDARKAVQPYSTPFKTVNSASELDNSSPKASFSAVDTCGGFLLEDEDEPERKSHGYRMAEEIVPALPDQRMLCELCQKRFAESFLWTQFAHPVCDDCRDPNDLHSLVTKTEAKQNFLLQDCDFGEREGPPLQCIIKKNPHSTKYGEMKLYLKCQVEKRSWAIWGGSEGLELERERRSEAREKRKEKRYAKQVKNLRRTVRSSLLQLSSASHEHTYPPDAETYSPETDTWTKTCLQCGFQLNFEKM